MMRDTDSIDQERRRRGADLTAELRDAISFPPLPPSPAEVGDLVLQTREHVQALGWGNREQLYTASQVRAIMSECAILAAARERERCARMAEEADVRRILRARRLTEELGHGEDTIAALEHMKRMQTALRVITTWCSFPPLDAAQVKRTASAALNPKANNG